MSPVASGRSGQSLSNRRVLGRICGLVFFPKTFIEQHGAKAADRNRRRFRAQSMSGKGHGTWANIFGPSAGLADDEWKGGG